jgi:two-component sensor histidine kinase
MSQIAPGLAAEEGIVTRNVASDTNRVDGGPPAKEPERKGFGMQVINRLIEERDGKLQSRWGPEGLACEITIPVEQLSGRLEFAAGG